jgi:hypothetical protein
METSGGDDSKKNFVKHVFNFDDDSKSEILNIIQYSLIALIPVVVLNKTMAKYIPEADENKGSLEIVAEVLIQVISMFMGLLVIHRLITFVPTYSGTKYPEYNITFIVLAVLMITLSLQTKLGEKVGLLFDRVTELWNGKSEKPGSKKGNVKVSQPIAGQGQGQILPQQQMIVNPAASMNQAAMTQSIYTDGTSIGSLPVNTGNQFGQGAGGQQHVGQQQMGGMMDGGMMEPMAANSALGSGAFGSW